MNKSEQKLGSQTRPITPKLKHPSIIEAVCELRFSDTVPYSLIPGAMRERLRRGYADFEVLPTATLMGGLPDMIPGPVPFHRFKTTDLQFLVQTGPRLLTVNVLPKYPGFEAFRDRILEALKQYEEAAEPKGATRLGLRYINLLEPREEWTQLSDYFRITVSHRIANEIPSEGTLRLVFPQGDLGQLAVTMSYPSRTATGATGALLDLDFFQNEPGSFNVDRFAEWLSDAHERVYDTFTSLVADELMSDMKGEP